MARTRQSQRVPEKLLVVRAASTRVDIRSYNCQELGLAKALAKRGVRTTVCMVGAPSGRVTQARAVVQGPTLEIVQLPGFRLPGQQALIPGLPALLNSVLPDIVQVHEDSQVSNLLVAILCAAKAIPVVLCQGMYRPYEGLLKRLAQGCFDAFARPIYRRTVNAFMAKTVAAKGYLEGKGYGPIAVCPVGLDIQQFANGGAADWRERLGLAPSSKIILYVGRLEARRNIGFMLGTFRNLARECPDAVLCLVGDGPEERKARAFTQDLQEAGSVHFVGKLRQEELAGLYRSAELLLLPSSYEIFGMVLLEAGYFKVPVLATPTAGAREIVAHSETGWLMDLDSDAWQRRISWLLRNPDERRRIGEAAHRRVTEAFSWDHLADCYLRVYRDILEHRSEVKWKNR